DDEEPLAVGDGIHLAMFALAFGGATASMEIQHDGKRRIGPMSRHMNQVGPASAAMHQREFVIAGLKNRRRGVREGPRYSHRENRRGASEHRDQRTRG